MCSYLQDTVTSILVAGTLVFRGSKSPIEAIISAHNANDHPQNHLEIWTGLERCDGSALGSWSQLIHGWDLPLGFHLRSSGGGRGRDAAGAEVGETDRRRDAESWEADFKVHSALCHVRPRCAPGVCPERWLGKEDSASHRWFAFLTGRRSSFLNIGRVGDLFFFSPNKCSLNVYLMLNTSQGLSV